MTSNKNYNIVLVAYKLFAACENYSPKDRTISLYHELKILPEPVRTAITESQK